MTDTFQYLHVDIRVTLRSVLLPAEASIYDLVVEGLSNKQIANRLGIGTGTIRNQMTRILHKTNTRSRCQLIAAHYKEKLAWMMPVS